jgi:hypothetical protein
MSKDDGGVSSKDKREKRKDHEPVKQKGGNEKGNLVQIHFRSSDF